MNRVAELHDSRITALERKGGDLVIHFQLYIHESEGIPGKDPGIGWYQQAQMTMHGLKVDDLSAESSEFPIAISDGFTIYDGQRHENGFDLPLVNVKDFELNLTTVQGTNIHLSSNSADLELTGTPGKPEKFSPKRF